MLVTVEEAKEKKCQETMRWNDAPYGQSRFHSDYCHGSNCMAWRWAIENDLIDDNGKYRVVSLKNKSGERLGYCGKCTVPEIIKEDLTKE